MVGGHSRTRLSPLDAICLAAIAGRGLSPLDGICLAAIAGQGLSPSRDMVGGHSRTRVKPFSRDRKKKEEDKCFFGN